MQSTLPPYGVLDPSSCPAADDPWARGGYQPEPLPAGQTSPMIPEKPSEAEAGLVMPVLPGVLSRAAKELWRNLNKVPIGMDIWQPEKSNPEDSNLYPMVTHVMFNLSDVMKLHEQGREDFALKIANSFAVEMLRNNAEKWDITTFFMRLVAHDSAYFMHKGLVMRGTAAYAIEWDQVRVRVDCMYATACTRLSRRPETRLA